MIRILTAVWLLGAASPAFAGDQAGGLLRPPPARLLSDRADGGRSDEGEDDAWRHEPPANPYRGWEAQFLAGGAAFFVVAAGTAITNWQCHDCTGRWTPWAFAGAGGAAWLTGGILWAMEPPRPPPREVALAWTFRF